MSDASGGTGLSVRPLDVSPGGLSLVGEDDPFRDAEIKLRSSSVSLQPNAIDTFAMKASPMAGEIWKKYEPILQADFENQQRAGQETLSRLENPPIDRSLPWLRMAAGMMKPTRTGSFGESLGSGIEGLASGFADVNKSELDFARRAAESRYGIAKDQLAGREGIVKAGMGASQLDAMIAMMRQRLGAQTLTPAIKEWLATKGYTPEDFYSGNISANDRKDLDRFILLARGTSQQKNAWTMLDPRNPNYANTVKLLANQPLMTKLMQIAESRHPMTAYEGQSLEYRNQKVNEELARLVQDHSLSTSLGTPLSTTPQGPGEPPAAAPAPAGAPPAAIPPAAPAPAAVVPAPVPTEVQHPFDEFIQPFKATPNVAGQIKDQATEAQQKKALEEAERRASTYIEKTVQPGIQAADELRSSAIIAKGLLDKDPKLTGSMKPFMGEFANFLTTLGLAPERAQQFATNVELFRSQAMLQVLAKQLEQKGVQTESDAKRIMQAGIDPSKPAEANRFMIRYMEAAADRMAERASFFDRWAKRNGGQMAGAVEGWNAYQKRYPLARVIDNKVHFRHIDLPGE